MRSAAGRGLTSTVGLRTDDTDSAHYGTVATTILHFCKENKPILHISAKKNKNILLFAFVSVIICKANFLRRCNVWQNAMYAVKA